jgi:hypothetical protein
LREGIRAGQNGPLERGNERKNPEMSDNVEKPINRKVRVAQG